jgi:hypothetical protein
LPYAAGASAIEGQGGHEKLPSLDHPFVEHAAGLLLLSAGANAFLPERLVG